MKKILFLTFTFLSLTHLTADSVEDKIRHMVLTHDKEVLLEISNHLLRMANTEHEEEDFSNAILHYREAMLIRNGLGMGKSKSQGNLMFLMALTYHESGNHCAAKSQVEEAIQIFEELSLLENAKMAKKEGQQFIAHCQPLAVLK